MSSEVRTIVEREGAWLRIVLDRAPGNLLSRAMLCELRAVLAGAMAPGRKWVSIEGSGAHFSFGAMLQEHLPGPMKQVLPETHSLLRQLLALPCATAALVQGRCLGGGFELALACDTILATTDATLGLPEIDLGVFPPAAAALLPARIGSARATESILTGAAATAKEWRDRGAVATVAPSGQLLAAAGAWFDAHLARRSAVGIAAAAQASRLALRASAEPALAAAEKLYLERVLQTHDAAEGARAFLEKRQPRWKDR